MRIVRGVMTSLILLAGTACVPDHLAFRADDRVTITAPDDHAEVTLPVTVRWRIEEFDVVEPGTPVREDAGFFAVFVDSSPMPAGKDLAWLVREDPACDRAKGCPNAKYLAERDVYITTATELRLTELAERTADGPERHRATIVLLDGSGRRLGESAFRIDFEVRRGAQS